MHPIPVEARGAVVNPRMERQRSRVMKIKQGFLHGALMALAVFSGCAGGPEAGAGLSRDGSSQGTAYLEQGEYDRAIEDFTQALRLNPDLAEA
ncbi:MAG: tetratricopeptide repeat protein, partial [Treponema sp.]|nr:tetratricopeptide repeat protein [Treponema sp.]